MIHNTFLLQYSSLKRLCLLRTDVYSTLEVLHLCAVYSASQKSSPPKTFYYIFACGEPVKLKISLVISQTYSYVYTNFRPFIWISVWIVSLLPVRSLKFYNSIYSIPKFMNFFCLKNKSHQIIFNQIWKLVSVKWIITLSVQNVHRWLTHMPAFICGGLSQCHQWVSPVRQTK